MKRVVVQENAKAVAETVTTFAVGEKVCFSGLIDPILNGKYSILTIRKMEDADIDALLANGFDVHPRDQGKT